MELRSRPRLLLVAIAFLIGGITACSQDPPPPSAPKHQRPLVILLGADPRTFDPQMLFEVDSGYVLVNIFESLIEFDNSFQLAPGLAKRWTNPDDRTWRFYLNEQARFSDGSYLKASDVRFSIERVKSLTDSDLRGFTEHIKAIRVVDDHTIDLKTETPLSILNDVVFIPILKEEHVRKLQDDIAEKPLGTGPYQLKQWEKNRQITLTVNPHYAKRPDVEQIQFVISSQPDKVLADVLRLKPDITLSLPFRRVSEFQKEKPSQLKIVSSHGLTVEYLVLNLRPRLPRFNQIEASTIQEATPVSAAATLPKNPLTDLRLRKALAHGTNREEIIRLIFRGFGRPATQLIAPEIFGFDPSIRSAEYNTEEAKRLIREAGYEGLEIPIHTLEGGSYRFENLLIEQWSKIGIRGKIRLWKDTEELNREMSLGNFAVTATGYVCTSGDAGEFITFGLHTRDETQTLGKGNFAFYSNPEVDRIGEQHLRVLNPKERLTMLQKAMKIVSEDLPYIPLLVYNDIYIVSDRIRWTPPVSGEVRVKYISYNR